MALVTHLADTNLTMLKLFRCPTNSRIERKSLMKTPQASKKIRPIGKQIAPAAELLLELRLYESCPNWRRGTRQGAEPPAGPPKMDLELGETTFSKKIENFRIS